MRLESAGLLQWPKLNADPSHCLKKIERETKEKTGHGKKKPLTLKGLSGAFLVLGIGYALTIAAFIVEVVHRYTRNRKDNTIMNIAEQNAKKRQLFVQVVVDLAAATIIIKPAPKRKKNIRAIQKAANATTVTMPVIKME